MKRAFIVLVERDKREALRELRKLGVLHLEPMSGAGSDYEELAAARQSVTEAVGTLAGYKAEPSAGELSEREGIELAAEVRGYEADAKAASDEALAITREIERIRSWGDFDPAAAAYLSAKGRPIRLVEVPAKKLPSMPDGVDYISLGQAKGLARLAVLAGEDTELPADCLEFRMPEKGLSELEAELMDVRSRAAAAREAVARKAPLAAALGRALAKIEREEAFEAARSGMHADEGLAWFSAWVPVADEKRLTAAASKAGWGLMLDEPLDDEQPPTKIENSAVIRIIQPVFDFLGTVPNYREYDISGLFLLFFTVFFAMIFGDGGYGSLMMAGGVAAAIASRRKTGKVSDPVRLLLLLAAATVAWGALTASWFGIPADRLPRLLLDIAIPAISSANVEAGDNIKLVCFTIGLVQLVIAHGKNVLRDRRSLKLVGQVGQAAMVFGIYWIVLNLVISAAKYVIPSWALVSIGAGFSLNVLFGSYDGSKGLLGGIIASVVSSLANIVSIFLGVVNIFADLVSYIRLWAVGLAGVGISQTVNQMAGPMLGKLSLWLIGGVILLGFGHGLNVILSVLSVIVHGVRLNMLEFSGHLGMEWSGYKFEPFKDTVPTGRVTTERSPS
ncbi:MAG: ATPase [Spirochaetes bacterium]|nr:ATPase [Spirochaetota bacterium]